MGKATVGLQAHAILEWLKGRWRVACTAVYAIIVGEVTVIASAANTGNTAIVEEFRVGVAV
jgi:hypothetical protein